MLLKLMFFVFFFRWFIYLYLSLSLPDPLEREYILVSNLEEFINYQFIVTVATAIGTNPEGDTPPPVQAKTMESGIIIMIYFNIIVRIIKVIIEII